MRIPHALGVVLACSVSLLAAETQTNPPPKAAAKTITLTGCVVRGEMGANDYAISDATEGAFRLTGMKLRDYVGKRVLIAGGVQAKRLQIKGGLLPSANIAAQAGAIDPTQAAMANAGGAAGPGAVQLPEFRVKGIRPVAGGCPG